MDDNGSKNDQAGDASGGAGLVRVWDRQRLLDRYGGDMETVIELCQALREDLPAKIARLNQAAEAGDPEALAAVAHSVKGICGTMAAEPCRARALQLELAARGGDAGAAAALLPTLLACLQTLLNELPE
jgi:HPt (histidine-containing phosphotransfer) domain-containing protein